MEASHQALRKRLYKGLCRGAITEEVVTWYAQRPKPVPAPRTRPIPAPRTKPIPVPRTRPVPIPRKIMSKLRPPLLRERERRNPFLHQEREMLNPFLHQEREVLNPFLHTRNANMELRRRLMVLFFASVVDWRSTIIPYGRN